MGIINCTRTNILVREYMDSETESGIVLGDGNSEPYSLYEIIEINDDTVSQIAEITGEGLTKEDLMKDYLLLYSGFARVPIVKNKFIVDLKDCLAVVKRDKYKDLFNE